MEYIKNKDYDYIRNKYHDSSKPFDSFARFIRRDEIFSDETGMDGEKIKEEILCRDEEIKHLPHPVRKAKAFEFILGNTKISCDSRDIFPAINMIDRPLNSTLVKKWKNEVFDEIIPETQKRRVYFEKAGIVTMWPDYDHSVPVWERIFGLGFGGLLRESELMRLSKTLTAEEDAFFEGIKITYTAIVSFIGRLYALAAKTVGSEKMAKALKNIKDNPPSTFYEALLVDYIYFILSEHIEGLQVRSLSNFDRIFYPYFKNDLEHGISEEEIRTELAYFFMQFTAIGNYWNQPVFLGGCKEDESTEINELSYLFLDVYDKMKIYNPKIQIKVADSTPKEFTLAELVKMLDLNFEGYENVRRKLLADSDKYGNNKDLPDSFATDITDFLAKYVCGKPNAKNRGGKWNIGFHVARMSYIQGKKTAASPNGRLFGEELSKNVSASMGQNREGATAAILSATKIDATAFTSDASLDLGLLPSAVSGDDGLAAMYGLLITFVKRGGHAMHINVFDAQTLREAQKNPEKYQDLQIRVSGWNVLWNNINKDEQDGFIRQAESLV